MVIPNSFPHVDYESVFVNGIESTPTLIVGAQSYVYVLLSLNVCNRSLNDIFVNFFISREVEIGKEQRSYFKENHLVDQNTSHDVWNTSSINGLPAVAESILILKPGDLLFGYSDSVNNKFDCQLSYCALLESADITYLTKAQILDIIKNIPDTALLKIRGLEHNGLSLLK